jgi:FG-GAP-like repeat
MKRILHLSVSLFMTASFVLLGSPVSIRNIVCAQTARQLPTRLQAGDTPADITLTRTLGLTSEDDLGLVVGVGDFNGDHLSDFLVSYSTYIDVFDSGSLRETMVRYGIFFGKPNTPEPLRINIDKRTPDLTLDLDFKLLRFISTIGDVNGDHIDDLLVIERVDDYGLGNLRILFGSPRLQPGHLNVTQQTPDIQIINPNPGRFSPIVVRAADLNGDGVKDLVMADSQFSTTNIYGVLGPFASGSTIDLRSQRADLIIRDKDEAHAEFLALADVNGDGKADVLVRRFAQAVPPNLGPTELAIVFGTADFSSSREISLTDGQADATFDVGFITGGFATGDINGDGNADILIGRTIRYDNGPPLTSGWIDVIFGSRTLQGRIDHPDAKISGLPPSGFPQPVSQSDMVDHLGASIVARDLNGDGFADITIGTLGMEDSDIEETLSPGRTHIIFGSADIANVSLEKEQQDLTIIFGPKQRTSGSPVNVGDFNGDGLADVLVGGIDVCVYFVAPLRSPQITQAKYRSGAEDLILSGTDFTGAARVEINGVGIDRELTFRPEQNQIVMHGSKAQLNLRDSKNQVTVIRKGARSNTIKVKVK